MGGRVFHSEQFSNLELTRGVIYRGSCKSSVTKRLNNQNLISLLKASFKTNKLSFHFQLRLDILKTSQELRMLSSVTINCQVNKDCHEFRFSIVCIVISVSNVTTSQRFFWSSQVTSSLWTNVIKVSIVSIVFSVANVPNLTRPTNGFVMASPKRKGMKWN